MLQRNGYVISGPRFTTRAAGPVDVRATLSPVAGFSFGIDLMYLSGPTPHNEGSGGATTTGPGPTLSGSWRVGFVGEFQPRVFLASPQAFPLPVPAEGLRVPVTFSVTHP